MRSMRGGLFSVVEGPCILWVVVYFPQSRVLAKGMRRTQRALQTPSGCVAKISTFRDCDRDRDSAGSQGLCLVVTAT
jgi:hypothetical protein